MGLVHQLGWYIHSDVSTGIVASIFRVSKLGSCHHATRTILITLHDAVTQNKAVCQYGVNESPEGGLRIRIGT